MRFLWIYPSFILILWQFKKNLNGVSVTCLLIEKITFKRFFTTFKIFINYCLKFFKIIKLIVFQVFCHLPLPLHERSSASWSRFFPNKMWVSSQIPNFEGQKCTLAICFPLYRNAYTGDFFLRTGLVFLIVYFVVSFLNDLIFFLELLNNDLPFAIVYFRQRLEDFSVNWRARRVNKWVQVGSFFEKKNTVDIKLFQIFPKKHKILKMRYDNEISPNSFTFC